MYTCHICKLETKQLNGLMSGHFKKHCNDSYLKQQYKIDLLNNNGRPQKFCKVCNKPTIIPKGENEYPIYCKSCYLENRLQGDNNPNWSCGKVISYCKFCNVEMLKYKSTQIGKAKFCSASCAQRYYGLPENRTEAQKANDRLCKTTFDKLLKSPIFRAKLAVARNTMAASRSSKKETTMVDLLKTIYPDCKQAHLVKYYTFDAFIPSLNLLVEFDGTYWHSLPKTISLDKRKELYITRWHPKLKLIRVTEAAWDNALNKLQLLKQLLPTY